MGAVAHPGREPPEVGLVGGFRVVGAGDVATWDDEGVALRGREAAGKGDRAGGLVGDVTGGDAVAEGARHGGNVPRGRTGSASAATAVAAPEAGRRWSRAMNRVAVAYEWVRSRAGEAAPCVPVTIRDVIRLL